MRAIPLAFVFGLIVAANCAWAQSAEQPKISSKDTHRNDGHDRPVGNVSLRFPSPSGGNGQTESTTPVPNPVPPSEGEDIPPSEQIEAPPPEEAPTYYGEPVVGNVGFLLDRSGSINATKSAALKAETQKVIEDLTMDQNFDIAAFNSTFPATTGNVQFMWGSMLPATDGNKAAAISWLYGPAMNSSGWTPLYESLRRAMEVYPAELNVFFLVTDGACLKQAMILAELPVWWQKFPEGRFVGVYVPPGCPPFVQQMVAVVDGTYIAT